MKRFARLTTILIPISLGGVLIFSGCSIEQDRADAQKAAAHINANLRAGDFAAIYRESDSRFKSVGSEAEFVSGMKVFQDQSGVLKKVVEVAYESGFGSSAGSTHILVSNLDYEHRRARERLTFVRSKTGEMVLWKLDIQPVD